MRNTALSLLAMAALANAAPKPDPQGVFPPPYDVRETFVVDEGDPQQVYLYKQISDRTHCGDTEGSVECTVGEEESKSYGISWGADISAAGWISAGFSVSEEVSTGTSHECSNKPGEDGGDLKEYICIWKRVGHTEYTVKDWKRLNTGGEWKEDSDNYQMWSPNSDDVGHDYVCAWDDDCWQKGDEWWGPSRTPGGPKQYDFDDKWQ